VKYSTSQVSQKVVVRQNKNISLDNFFSTLQQKCKILNSGCKHTGGRAKIGEKASKNNRNIIPGFAISHTFVFLSSQYHISANLH